MYLAAENAAAPEHSLSQHEALYELGAAGKSVPGPSETPLPNFVQFISDSSNSGSIAERAWMMKMANELAKRYEDEREKGTFGPSREATSSPPPAYAR